MKNENQIKIFLVDDDALFLKSLEIEFLQHTDHLIETYPTGELCIAHLSHQPDVIILDYYLDGVDTTAMNGLQTLNKIIHVAPLLPVVMLSAQDNIDVAVSCMHHKAFDYVIKSETAFLRLQKIISSIQRFKKMENELGWYMDRM